MRGGITAALARHLGVIPGGTPPPSPSSSLGKSTVLSTSSCAGRTFLRAIPSPLARACRLPPITRETITSSTTTHFCAGRHCFSTSRTYQRATAGRPSSRSSGRKTAEGRHRFHRRCWVASARTSASRWTAWRRWLPTARATSTSKCAPRLARRSSSFPTRPITPSTNTRSTAHARCGEATRPSFSVGCASRKTPCSRRLMRPCDGPAPIGAASACSGRVKRPPPQLLQTPWWRAIADAVFLGCQELRRRCCRRPPPCGKGHLPGGPTRSRSLLLRMPRRLRQSSEGGRLH
mmetsp:Transcript_90310/g.200630  ORF Transcript_90310/g.200630 Transcript_90310/m.200630 type:complete len:291 (+) Transcript_90310:183-1055(+)